MEMERSFKRGMRKSIHFKLGLLIVFLSILKVDKCIV